MLNFGYYDLTIFHLSNMLNILIVLVNLMRKQTFQSTLCILKPISSINYTRKEPKQLLFHLFVTQQIIITLLTQVNNMNYDVDV